MRFNYRGVRAIDGVDVSPVADYCFHANFRGGNLVVTAVAEFIVIFRA